MPLQMSALDIAIQVKLVPPGTTQLTKEQRLFVLGIINEVREVIDNFPTLTSQQTIDNILDRMKV